MFKPGNLIKARSSLTLANVRYDDRPIKNVFTDAIAASPVNMGGLAIVIASYKIRHDENDHNEIYVLLMNGRCGWTYGELWKRLTMFGL